MKLAASASRTLLLLAPSRRAVPAQFEGVDHNPLLHENLLAETQRFRGRIYREDGAIQPWQLTDGRHRLDIDQGSWHLLVLDQRGRVCGCARYREYPAGARFSALTVSQSPLAISPDWGRQFQSAVDAERRLSMQLDYPLSELGGWALDEEIRKSAEALRMALATYALTQELGGGIGLSSVTQRHDSASILRRMGGHPLEHRGDTLPPYYDPHYDCQMEILRFYSWAPNPRYAVWIEQIKSQLRTAPVVTSGAEGPEWVGAMRSRAVDLELRHAAAG